MVLSLYVLLGNFKYKWINIADKTKVFPRNLKLVNDRAGDCLNQCCCQKKQPHSRSMNSINIPSAWRENFLLSPFWSFTFAFRVLYMRFFFVCVCRRSVVIPCPKVLLSMKISSQGVFLVTSMNECISASECLSEYLLMYGVIPVRCLRHFERAWHHLSFPEWQFISPAVTSESLPKEPVLFQWTPELLTCSRWFE